jgi:hypothetical protein
MLASLTHPCSGAFVIWNFHQVDRNLLDFRYLLPKIQNYIIWCENLTSHMTMMGGGMMFCQIIRLHKCSRAPIESELYLIDSPIA